MSKKLPNLLNKLVKVKKGEEWSQKIQHLPNKPVAWSKIPPFRTPSACQVLSMNFWPSLYIDIVVFDSQLSSVCIISFLDIFSSKRRGGSSRKGDTLDITSIENMPNYSTALGILGTIYEVFAIAVYCYCCY